MPSSVDIARRAPHAAALYLGATSLRPYNRPMARLSSLGEAAATEASP